MLLNEELPRLPDGLQEEYEECLRSVRATAQRLREAKFGRFTQTNTPQAAIDYGSLDRPSKPRQTTPLLLSLSKAALVIGHNGEGLKRIEKMAQVRIQLDNTSAGHFVDQRRLLITGYPEDVEEARRIIEEGALGGGQSAIQVSIPQSRVGLIIGRGGETIRELQEKSGAKVMVAPDLSSSTSSSSTSERIVSIMGDPDAIQRAKNMIDQVVFGIDPNNLNNNNLNSNSSNNVLLQVPEACIGSIIGKKAENLRAIQAMSGARVHIEPSPLPGTCVRNVYVSGAPEAVAYAKQLLEDRIASVDSAYGGGYGYDVAGGGVVYQAPGEFGYQQVTPVAYYDYNTYYSQIQKL